MENSTIQFASGMNFKARHPNAPETVRGAIYFKASDFKKFLDDNADSRGYVNVKMMKSKKDGSIYFILDDFVPKSQVTPESIAYNETKYQPVSGNAEPTVVPAHRHVHPDVGVQAANEKMAEQLFNRPLSEEEEFRMSQTEF